MEENEELWVIETDQGDGWTRVRRIKPSSLDPMPEGFVPTSYIETLELFSVPQSVQKLAVSSFFQVRSSIVDHLASAPPPPTIYPVISTSYYIKFSFQKIIIHCALTNQKKYDCLDDSLNLSFFEIFLKDGL